MPPEVAPPANPSERMCTMAGLKAMTQYQAVRKRVDAGMKVGEAIKETAKEIGISQGTVHTSYYRVARMHGSPGTLQTRTPRRGGRKRTGYSNGNVSTEAALQRVNEAVAALQLCMERDESELAALRKLRDLARAS